MTKTWQAVLCLLAFAPTASQVSAEIFRCVGPNGQLTLQQLPCTATNIGDPKESEKRRQSTLQNLSGNKDVRALLQRCSEVKAGAAEYPMCNAMLSCVDEGRFGTGLSQCIDERHAVTARELDRVSAAERLLALKKKERAAKDAAIAEGDPRALFATGDKFESDKLAKLQDRYFPDAKYYPNMSFRVSFKGATYLVQTRKLNDTGTPAIYEIVSVTADAGSVHAQQAQRSRPPTNETPVDCYALSKLADAQGHGFFERAAIVGNAERKGLCRW